MTMTMATQRIYSRVLAALFVLSAVLCPVMAEADVWLCEGRTCAVLIGGCCCAAPDGDRDATCAAPRPSGRETPQAGNGIGETGDPCGCVQAVTDCDAHDAVTLAGVPAYDLGIAAALLPATPALYVAPALIDTPSHRIDTRGPPRRAVALSSPCLRAPPAA